MLDNCSDLPQPQRKKQQKYIYIPQGYPQNNINELNNDESEDHDQDFLAADNIVKEYFPPTRPYTKDTLVWVLKGKGTNKKSNKKRSNAQLFLRARVVCDNVTDENENKEFRDNKGNITDENDRVLVRYSKGSTYRVRKSNLIPVLEKDKIDDRIVLVLPETPDYRRASIVHTCIGETFLEIGCDFGCTVHRVQKALLNKDNDDIPPESANVPQTSDIDEKKVVALGIDKSTASIAVAKARYQQSHFFIEDALTKEGSANIRSLCQKTLTTKFPSVVAIDINGNRELPAVLECIERIMNPEYDNNDLKTADNEINENEELKCNGMDWELPRLIIVKSRTLYELLIQRKKKGSPLN